MRSTECSTSIDNSGHHRFAGTGMEVLFVSGGKLLMSSDGLGSKRMSRPTKTSNIDGPGLCPVWATV